ncbi:MAG TPA: glycosyltransferase [Rhizomicrobium sp.]|nr:glycosyltransferase [Rhizomicrobium sp.]
MKIVSFVHAIASCWNNGNAHFLRGLGLSLQAQGQEMLYCEPRGSWSETNLLQDHGPAALASFRATFPTLKVEKYDPAQPDLDRLTDGADLVIVHEWNDPALVNALGQKRARGAAFSLLFHDTHHRAATAPEEMRRFDLSGYDGVLAFGESIAEIYRARGWAKHVWAFHEAADTRTFYPPGATRECDVVWIGNWGDEERSAELRELLVEPAQSLNLHAVLYGVRYPDAVVEDLKSRRVEYRGWLPNHEAPLAFAKAAFTVHVPRGPYARALSGIPTIRVFEALACGIPLISAPWEDSETLFPPDCYLTAGDGNEMRAQMSAILQDTGLREELARNGLAAIAARHTCDHRAAQLLDICASLNAAPERQAA